MSYKVNSFLSVDKVVPAYEKNLSICLAANGFSFTVTTQRDDFLAFGDVAFEGAPAMAEAMSIVRGAFAECGIIPLGMHVELVVASDFFVWVPDSLYTPGNDRRYLDPICDVPRGHSLFVDHNDKIGAYLIFAAESAFCNAFKIAIPGLKVRCQHSRLVNDQLLALSDLRSLMLLHVRPQHLDVEVFCNKTLQLSNSYPAQGREEVLYQALRIAKQLKLEEATMSTLLCGDVDRSFYEEVCRFLPNVDLYCGHDLTPASDQLRQVPTYKYATII